MTLALAVEPAVWRGDITKTGVLPADAGTWWSISASRPDNAPISAIVIAPDFAKCRMELVTGTGDHPRADDDALALAGTLAVLNAGYFTSDHRTVGWQATAGSTAGEVDDGLACTGFAWITTNGALRLTRRSDGTPTDAQWGIQAGPFLIDPGGTDGINREGGPSARRSVIALTTDGQPVLIAIADPLTLSATADLLLVLPTIVPLSPCAAALNLDGGPSTTLAIPSANIHQPARGAVITAWRVVAR